MVVNMKPFDQITTKPVAMTEIKVANFIWEQIRQRARAVDKDPALVLEGVLLQWLLRPRGEDVNG